MKTPLEGSVASIRPLRQSDAEEYLALLMRNKDFLSPYEPVRPSEYWTLSGQRDQLAVGAADWDLGTGYAFAIIDRSDGALVGRVALANVVRKAWQNATLGYWLDAEHNGRGLATDAARLAVRFAFADASLHRVQAGVMPRNTRSIRVLEKIGMRYEGLALRYLLINGAWEDHRMYGVTADEWTG
ncbi:MAG TPA: GNAT family protein [Actinomycetota bacterium]|nr:GNAT family protein [Actinomycetota bacterium]